MADEKMNDKEDEQCDKKSQACVQTTPSSNPVPIEQDPVPVEEDPVKEAPETDQQPVRNRRSSSPTGEEVESEGKRPGYAGGSSSDSNLELPDPNSPLNQENTSEFSITPAPAPAHIPPVLSLSDLIQQLLPAIESWLHSHITEFVTLPPTTTLSIPGVPNNSSRPPRPPKPPIPPPPKLSAISDQRQRIQQAPPPGDGLYSHIGLVNRLLKLEAVVKILKDKFSEMSIVTEDMVTEVDDFHRRVQDLEAVVNKLKGGSDDKLKAEVVAKKSTEGQGEIASGDNICSLDELKKDDNTSQDEMKDYYTCQDQLMDANTSQDELMDDKASEDAMKDDNASTFQDDM